MTSNENGIHTKAMLVRVRISTWSGRKHDKKVTAEIHQRHGADDEAGHYLKYLLGKNAEEHKRLLSLAQKTYQENYKLTLPWDDEGWRLLPTAQYMDFTEWFRGRKVEFEEAKKEFKNTFPELKERAKTVLGDMFNPRDYPTPSQIDAKFDMSAHFNPLPLRGDFRVDLPEDAITRIEQETENRIQDAVQEAMMDCWERLHTTVEKVHERLADPGNIFRDSLIGNVRDLVDILTRLNVTNDPDLEKMRQRVEQEISIYEPGALRENKDMRADVADAAEKIMNDMSAYFPN